MDGAGLDLGEVGAEGGEFVERGDERAGTILHGKCDADFVGLRIGLGVGRAADEKEAGVVFRVVFNAGLENFGAIVLGRGPAGDGSEQSGRAARRVA